jgi:hypothetical protein
METTSESEISVRLPLWVISAVVAMLGLAFGLYAVLGWHSAWLALMDGFICGGNGAFAYVNWLRSRDRL